MARTAFCLKSGQIIKRARKHKNWQQRKKRMQSMLVERLVLKDVHDFSSVNQSTTSPHTETTDVDQNSQGKTSPGANINNSKFNVQTGRSERSWKKNRATGTNKRASLKCVRKKECKRRWTDNQKIRRTMIWSRCVAKKKWPRTRNSRYKVSVIWEQLHLTRTCQNACLTS